MKLNKRKNKPKAVILDFDDTLCSFVESLCCCYNQIHETCITPMDFKSYSLNECNMTDAQGNKVEGKDVMALFKTLEQHGLYASLRSLPDVNKTLSIVNKLGYKIILLTARNSEYKQQTELSLMLNNIQYDELLFAKSDEKAKVIRRLSKDYNCVMFVDDKASTVIDVFNTTNVNHVILKDMPHNREVEIDSDIERIDGIFNIIRFLKDVSNSS